MRYLVVLICLLLGACAPGASPAPAAPGSVPPWRTLPLTNARTGETFTLADFEGKVVYIEPMATWCTNCRVQMAEVIQVHQQLNADEYAFVSLSLAETVTDEQLAAYADERGYPWVFAVATPEMIEALVTQYGRGVTVPPSTPHFILTPDGRASGLATGQHSAQTLINDLMGARNV